ncbi:MAG: hypothetical protein Kow0010_19640 [Dehalococcoidia bacterium]
MSKRAPKQPAAERRRRILDGASSVFATSSYARADTAELAAAAGVKPSALYRYFPSKRDLYLAVLREASPRLLRLWERAFADAEDPLQGLWAIGMAYYDHSIGRSPMMRLWFQAMSETSDPDVRAAVRETLTGAVDVIAANIADGQARGIVRRDVDPRVAAWHFMGIGIMFDLLAVLGLSEELDRPTAEAWGRFFIDSIREGPQTP